MNEKLKVNFEVISKVSARDTITALINGKDFSEAKSFAIKTIDDWKKEDKEDLVADFKKWLLEKGIDIENY